MADTGIFATTAQIGYKAGAKASATSKAEAYTNFYIGQAESFINVSCKYNFSDAYAAMNVDYKLLLQEAASNIAAIYVINYDTSGFNSRREAELMIDVLHDRATRAIELLKQGVAKDFIIGA